MKKVNCWFKAGEIYDSREAWPNVTSGTLIRIAGTKMVSSPHGMKTKVIYTVLAATEIPIFRNGSFWTDECFVPYLIRVFPKDLPLHMGAGWLSREFEKMLKELPHG